MKEARPMTDPMTNIRSLPIYQLGFHDGQDIGLRLALDAICAELTREDERTAVAEVTAHPSSSETKIHAYAAGGESPAPGRRSRPLGQPRNLPKLRSWGKSKGCGTLLSFFVLPQCVHVWTG
jgi:hypothetical protein